MHKHRGAAIAFLIFSVLSSVLFIKIPSLCLIFAILTVVFSCVSLYILKPYFVVVPFAFSSLIVYLLSKNIFSTALSVMFLIVGFFVFLSLKQKRTLKQLLLRSIIGGFLFFTAVLLSFIFVRGGSVSLSGAKQAFMPYISDYLNKISSNLDIIQKFNPSLSENLRSSFDFTKDILLNIILPEILSLIIVAIGFVSFIGFLIARYILNRYGFTFEKEQSISEFKLSRTAAIVSTICFILGFFAVKWDIAIAAQNIFIILNSAFFLGGVVFLNNFMKAVKFDNTKRTLYLFGIFFLSFIGFGAFVSVAGVFSAFGEIKNISDINK